MQFTVNNTSYNVISGEITWNLRGPWTADLVLDTDRDVSGTGDITVGTAKLHGTVKASGNNAGRATVRIVGGFGGLSRSLASRQYRGTPLSRVLKDWATDAGEVLSTGIDGSYVFQTWVRNETTASKILDELATLLSKGWRVLDTGNVWFGNETWTASKSAAKQLDENTTAGIITLDNEDADLRPGTLWADQKIATVQLSWSSGGTRTKAWVYRETRPALAEALAKRVAERLPSGTWSTLHPSTVIKQDADGTLQVKPDSATVPPMAGVPLRTGIPSATVEVSAGARVLLAFENSDPTKPMAIPAWDADDTKLVKVTFGQVSSAQYVALANKVDDLFYDLKTWLNGHIHTTPVGSSGPGLKDGVGWQMSGPASVACTKVKAQ